MPMPFNGFDAYFNGFSTQNSPQMSDSNELRLINKIEFIVRARDAKYQKNNEIYHFHLCWLLIAVSKWIN